LRSQAPEHMGMALLQILVFDVRTARRTLMSASSRRSRES
jgi:hypothetical protein